MSVCSLGRIRALINARNIDYIRTLLWFPGLDIGWYPCHDVEYPDEYFEKFEYYKTTQMGKHINDFRVSFVNSIYSGDVVDVGIGAGYFIEQRGEQVRTYGYDVSEYGKRWLTKRDLEIDPYNEDVYAITCWDSLEHIRDCWTLVQCAQRFVFTSIPIVRSAEDAMKSKHFKPHEHYWYMTHEGLIRCFNLLGFELIDSSVCEMEYGREEIGTYAFERLSGVPVQRYVMDQDGVRRVDK